MAPSPPGGAPGAPAFVPHALAYHRVILGAVALSRGLAARPAAVVLPAGSALDAQELLAQAPPAGGESGGPRWDMLQAAGQAADAADPLGGGWAAALRLKADALDELATAAALPLADSLAPAALRVSGGERIVLAVDAWLAKEVRPGTRARARAHAHACAHTAHALPCARTHRARTHTHTRAHSTRSHARTRHLYSCSAPLTPRRSLPTPTPRRARPSTRA